MAPIDHDPKSHDHGSEHHDVHIVINRKPFTLDSPTTTGRALKDLAGIPPADTLFRDRPGEDEVVTNDATIEAANGDRFHSAPPADYGDALDETILATHCERFLQPDGWTFIVTHGLLLPAEYEPRRASCLVKLPPLFPEAQPDMFWLSPHVHVRGGAPRGTCTEQFLGEAWQRFSWHLAPGAWVPGVSTLEDFMRAVRARLERRD